MAKTAYDYLICYTYTAPGSAETSIKEGHGVKVIRLEEQISYDNFWSIAKEVRMMAFPGNQNAVVVITNVIKLPI